MSTTTVQLNPRLRRQLTEGKALLRELRVTLEDLEDRIELAGAKKRNRGRPGTSWEDAKKEFGWNF